MKSEVDHDTDVHVSPSNDAIEHQESIMCDCRPIWDEENKREFEIGLARFRVIVHNRIKDTAH